MSGVFILIPLVISPASAHFYVSASQTDKAVIWTSTSPLQLPQEKNLNYSYATAIGVNQRFSKANHLPSQHTHTHTLGLLDVFSGVT